MTKTVFNILAICGAAGFSGVMLCIGVTLGGYWQSLQPQDFLEWFAVNDRFLMTVITLIAPPTIIGVVGSLWISWNSPDFRLWALSTLCIAIVMVMTAVYYLPANTAFANGSVEIGEVANRLNQWILIHYVRIALAMLASVFGVFALIKSERRSNRVDNVAA